jgi:signal transduction histidine kinase
VTGRFDLRARLLFAFLVPTLVVLAVGGYLLYRESRNALEDELGRSLSAVAAAVAAQVKADRVLALEPDDAVGDGSRTFRSLSAQVGELKTQTQVRRVLLFDRERRARLDVGGPLPPLAEVPELLRDTLELDRVFAGQPAASQVLFEGTDGHLYKTGYAPLRLDGHVVGAVAVEGSAAFFGPLTGLRNAFLGLAALMVALLALAAVLSAETVRRPIDALVRSALRIGAGDLATPVASAGPPEIGILARELEAMRTSLESRDRQLKLMLGGVAHEVKNPLGGIELFTGLLTEELAASAPNLADAQHHVATIRRELDYLTRIVDDFLAFAREQKLQLARVPVTQVLSAAVDHLAGEAAARHVTVRLEPCDAMVEADERLLTSALVNLLKNAVQISTAGQAVEVGAHVEHQLVCLEVIDHGPGIAPAQLAHIFEPFFTTKEQGTGLGLPLARKLAEAHHGTLTLESAPGRTVFRLHLPVARGIDSHHVSSG